MEADIHSIAENIKIVCGVITLAVIYWAGRNLARDLLGKND